MPVRARRKRIDPLPEAAVSLLYDLPAEFSWDRHWYSHPGRLRELWEAHRAEVLAWWIRHHPGTRPSLWWKFDVPEPRPPHESQQAYLARLNLLTADERKANE